ncbi:hypothetical protein [uncultured Salinicola sp.]|uniref:hypothetical protein n=1 Tax=uncultured Salinicola sp. TaxID=1193542 RepID=UPI00260CA0EB|nr:hypothetical protein [uncultured Salinicola sp.]|tara:strand:- start:970 stop:1527 length:558 start_codon:yes stop_codon:yes gene_type:complete
MDQRISGPTEANDDAPLHVTVTTPRGSITIDDFTDDDMMDSFGDPNAFDPDKTYRFHIAFHTGDDDDIDLRGLERVVLKSFNIALTAEGYERLAYLDDHEGVWTRMWGATAHKFGQLGDCSAPALGVFGFDTQEIDDELQQDRLMRVWKWFLRHHGYATGPIETAVLTPEAFEQTGDNPFRHRRD